MKGGDRGNSDSIRIQLTLHISHCFSVVYDTRPRMIASMYFCVVFLIRTNRRESSRSIRSDKSASAMGLLGVRSRCVMKEIAKRNRWKCNNTKTPLVRSKLRRAHYFWYDHTLRRTTPMDKGQHSDPRPGDQVKKARLTSSLGRQSVDGVVALAVGPDLSAESERGGGTKRAAVSVDVGDANLDGRVVLRGDEAVCEMTGEEGSAGRREREGFVSDAAWMRYGYRRACRRRGTHWSPSTCAGRKGRREYPVRRGDTARQICGRTGCIKSSRTHLIVLHCESARSWRLARSSSVDGSVGQNKVQNCTVTPQPCAAAALMHHILRQRHVYIILR